jgi:hypothetical protein
VGLDELTGGVEFWQNCGLLVVLQVDPVADCDLGLFYLFLDFVARVGPVVEEGEDAANMSVLELLGSAEHAEASQVEISLEGVAFLDLVDVVEVDDLLHN